MTLPELDKFKIPSARKAPQYKVELPVSFSDNSIPAVIRDKFVIRACPILAKSIESQNENWETITTIVKDPLALPFPEIAVRFLLSHVLRYADPDSPHAKIANYQDMMNLRLHDIRNILELSNFLECDVMGRVCGYVLAEKLKNRTTEEVARFLGRRYYPEEKDQYEDDEWMLPEQVHQPSSFRLTP